MYSNQDKKVLVVFIFIFLIIVNNYAQSLKTGFFSPEKRLSFANYLFSEKDYLRAAEEYREYLKYIDNDTIRFKYAECYLRIRRFEDAAENFKSLFFNSSLEDEAKLNFYKANFLLSLSKSNFLQFRDLVVKEVYIPENYKKEISRLKLISYLFDNYSLPDTNQFFSAFDDSNYVMIRKLYFMKKYPDYKNPIKAGLLSAVLPGLGKIYSKNISDGITAFIATGLLAYLSINYFNYDHKFRGWLFGGLSLLTYAGSIYGSISSAQIFNAKKEHAIKNEIRKYFEERNYLLPKFDF